MNTPLTKSERICAGLAMLAPLLGILAVGAVVSLFCGGCLNIQGHCGSGRYEPFRATCEVARSIAVPFVGATGPEAAIEEAYATVFLPLSLVALPCEAVADTVTFPYDIIKGTSK